MSRTAWKSSRKKGWPPLVCVGSRSALKISKFYFFCNLFSSLCLSLELSLLLVVPHVRSTSWILRISSPLFFDYLGCVGIAISCCKTSMANSSTHGERWETFVPVDLIFHSNMDFGSGLGCSELDGQSNDLGFCIPIGPLQGGPKSGPTFTRGFHVYMGFGPTFWTALVTVTWVGICSVSRNWWVINTSPRNLPCSIRPMSWNHF